MRTLISTVLLFMITSIGLAQETPPAGSAERGHQTFMKYMCYTCHGTLGQGADRGTGPKLAPGLAALPGVCAPGAHAAPRYAGLPQRIRQRSGVGGYLCISLDRQAVTGGEGYSVAEI